MAYGFARMRPVLRATALDGRCARAAIGTRADA